MIAPDITTATDASVVHKRQSGGSGRKGHPQAKRQRRVSPESKAPNCTTVPMEVEPVFPKLDPSNPVHANRILQRRKAVQKGKNTAGYTRYVENVPKETRRPRSMETPLTPDHTLDIPTKRWQGLLRAWRVALHKYDPPDLVNTHSDQISNAAVSDEKDDPKTPNRANEIDTNVAKGLLVELTPHQQQQTPMEDTTPISVLTDDSRRRELDDDFKNAANNPINKLVGWGDMSDSDDDDDLL